MVMAFVTFKDITNFIILDLFPSLSLYSNQHNLIEKQTNKNAVMGEKNVQQITVLPKRAHTL